MDYCLSLPFDQYQRYKLVSDIIDKFRTKERKFKILDVGAGFEENLKKFLPFDDIYCLDKEYPSEYSKNENFIAGDILNIEFKEKYDFVVAVDVYEHIPEGDRNKFIDIIVPLSEIATIIAAPFDQDEVRRCEFFANEVYRNVHGSDYIWLKEHLENGLPSLPYTLDLIKNHHLNLITIPNGYLPRWFEMISTYLLTEGKPEFQPMMTTLSELYNQNYYQYDNRNPAYRQIIIIPKGDRKIDFSDLVARNAIPEEIYHKNQLLASFIEKIKQSYQIYQINKEAQEQKIIAKDAQLKEIDQQIRDISAQVATLTQTLADKDQQLLETSAKVTTLTQTLADKDQQLLETSAKVTTLTQTLADKDQQLLETSAKVTTLTQTLADKDQQIQEASHKNILMEQELSQIKNSIVWRTTMMFQTKVVDRLLKLGTRRRKYYDLGLKGGRILINEGFKKTYTEFKNYRRSNKFFSLSQNNKSQKSFVMNNSVFKKTVDSPVLDPHIQKKAEYIPLSNVPITLMKDDIRFIAFYLPQFHPIPENDRWWGKGFTEWTNVTKAVPQFIGHYQPHLPDELGFYDLRLPEVQKRQIELAKHYGLSGFCFYYYWFNGKRLLERPLIQYIEHKEFDFPFCLCWANENWTRRWDGLENEILMEQDHSPENDIQFIKDVEHLFRDPRYIRINGKPLLIIYRATLLPEPHETIMRWRKYCKDCGIGDIYLVAALCFGCSDPIQYGFDAAIEFPPHTMQGCSNITQKMSIINPNFSGTVFDYQEFVQSKKYLQSPSFKVFRTVSPGWDNTARRPNNASIFYGANPQVYKEWLTDVTQWTQKTHSQEEQIVFINAWNEWAEGTHLEPDKKFGYGYLQATADVVVETRIQKKPLKKKIILVSHDAHLHGAQMLAVHLAKVLKEHFHYEVHLLLKSGGRLEEVFKKYSTVYNLEKDYSNKQSLEKLIQLLRSKNIDIAICNTVVTGDIVEILVKNHIKTLSLIHELPGVIKQFGQEENAKTAARYADKLIFPSEFVKTNFLKVVPVDISRCEICPQGLFLKNTFKDRKAEARVILRQKLSLPDDAKIILNVGYADFRKAVDIFADVAEIVTKNESNTFFVWVGHQDDNLMKTVRTHIEKSKIKDKILFPGIRTDDLDIFYSGADIFLLTSREDPFPSVVLDAMNAEVPVVGFADAGGFQDIVTRDTGILVPFLDRGKMSEAVTNLLNNPKMREQLGRNASKLIEKRFLFLDYVYSLLAFLNRTYKKVSVVIPNFNYKHYLNERVSSVLQQTYPIYEIIFLDDASSDNSVEFIRNFAAKSLIPVKILLNTENSGSVFRQWSKGISMASGDYIWIAEADDLCEDTFVDLIIAGFDDDTVVLSYSQSQQIDSYGKVLENNYFEYTNDIDKMKWKNDYKREGKQEICDTLVIKNSIPNVSGAIFKKYDISKILDELVNYKVAGDWYFYVWLLTKGSISYHSKSLNLHRRHNKSITILENAKQHYNEIVSVQDYIIKNFPIEENTLKKVFKYREIVKKYLLKEAGSSNT